MTTDRSVEAPELREVATIWWDVERDPVVCWDAAGERFELVDPLAPNDHRLVLARFAGGVDAPAHVAQVLADGLAACDFPPTESGASPHQVARALAAAGRPDLRPAGS
jgi:hypothetical protein